MRSPDRIPSAEQWNCTADVNVMQWKWQRNSNAVRGADEIPAQCQCNVAEMEHLCRCSANAVTWQCQ
eukprot:7940885-Pyramimonas_sp.AAC.1